MNKGSSLTAGKGPTHAQGAGGERRKRRALVGGIRGEGANTPAPNGSVLPAWIHKPALVPAGRGGRRG